MIPSGSCRLYCLGCVEYGEALAFQGKLASRRQKEEIPDSLLLLEHPPTYTLGGRSQRQHFKVPQEWIDSGEVSVFDVNRGGQITFHGPGQLVGYPIFRLGSGMREIARYIRNLEKMLILALLSLGVHSRIGDDGVKRISPAGVWVNYEKIGAIGIRVDASRVTTHGFALNISTDLDYFERIISCGVANRRATSLERCLGHPVPMKEVIDKVVAAFSEVFYCEFSEPYTSCVV